MYKPDIDEQDISVFSYPLPDQTGNRKAKDSLFTSLFNEPKYALQLYKILHPEETDITENDIQPATLNNTFTTGRYNDLGMLVRDRLIILVEAQSTWNPNMPLRFLLYIADTGTALQLKVKMLYTSNDGDILKQYMSFCRIYSEQYILHDGDIKSAVAAALEICEHADVLSEYISEHRPEVQDNMITCLQDQEYVTMIHELNVRKEALEEGRALGVAETEAKYQTMLNEKQVEIAKLKAQLKSLTDS